MRRLLICILVLLVPVGVAACQVPESADTLAAWEPPSDVATYTAGDDTLHVLGDSTWVALQDTVSIGCELGPDGAFWVFRPEPRTRRWIRQADTTLQEENLQHMYYCVSHVQWLWQYKEGLR